MIQVFTNSSVCEAVIEDQDFCLSVFFDFPTYLTGSLVLPNHRYDTRGAIPQQLLDTVFCYATELPYSRLQNKYNVPAAN